MMTEETPVQGAPAKRRLANNDLEIVLPVEVADRLDVLAMASTPGVAMHRLLALALGLCWPKFRRYYRYTGDALAYAATVERVVLVEHKEPLSKLLAAGKEALALITANLPAIEGSEDFTAPPAFGTPGDGGASSGVSSPLSEPGPSTQDGSASNPQT